MNLCLLYIKPQKSAKNKSSITSFHQKLAIQGVRIPHEKTILEATRGYFRKISIPILGPIASNKKRAPLKGALFQLNND